MSPSSFYTEIRIMHKTKEEKTEYELALDKALKECRYKTRTEFVQEKIRDILETSKDKDLNAMFQKGVEAEQFRMKRKELFK